MNVLRETLGRDDWARMAAEPAPPLLALWADTREIYALLHDAAPRLVSTPIEDGGYPALSPSRPMAAWFERAVHDLWGHGAIGGIDQRPWLDHGKWAQVMPMALRPAAGAPAEPPDFPACEGFDQVPVGPVQGGFRPAAHVRLGIRGEIIVRAETRLGYSHKGTLTLMRGKSPRAAARFAARLAGEATVAHSIAFARATEAVVQCDVPERATALRAVAGELERITSHLDALAVLAEAVEVGVLAARCARQIEALRRAAMVAFGHRLMMDCVVPGGMATDIAPGGAEAIRHALVLLTAELPAMARLPLDRALAGVGVVTAEQARLFADAGVSGLVGDAAGRAAGRFAAIEEGIRLLHRLLGALPEGVVSAPLAAESGEGVGYAAGPSGGIWHWLRLDHGQIASVFMRDPAWAHWPLLERVLSGVAMDDWPAVFASFGLSASGADL